MNVRPNPLTAPALRLPSANGADPLAAAHRSGAPLDVPDDHQDAIKASSLADASLEAGFAAKAVEVHAAAATKQTKDFELNVRRADIVNCIARARAHDGRKLCTPHDASVLWQIEALIHTIAGGKSVKPDPEFDDPDSSRPINSSVDRAISGVEFPANSDVLQALAALSRSVAELRHLRTEALEVPPKAVPVDPEPGV